MSSSKDSAREKKISRAIRRGFEAGSLHSFSEEDGTDEIVQRPF